MDYFRLELLSRIPREGVSDLDEAAKRMGLPLAVVQGVFEDGLPKGYSKIADGNLLLPSSPDETTKRLSGSSQGRGSNSMSAA